MDIVGLGHYTIDISKEFLFYLRTRLLSSFLLYSFTHTARNGWTYGV